MRRDEERTEREGEGEDCVRKPDQAQEARYSVFAGEFDPSSQERLESCPREGKNRLPVGEEQAFEGPIEQLPERGMHSPLVGAIFCWQQAEPIRLEVDQRIPDDKGTSIVGRNGTPSRLGLRPQLG